MNPDSITPNHQSVGVSKLIVSGPSPLSHSNSSASGKLDNRHNRSQSNTRDNPYYYYKSASERAASDATSCNSSTSNLLNQDHQNHQGTSKSGLSMVRSRSSGKMSTRSTTGKYKARNLRTRLVEDLRSLTITNSQTTPSSLSTSPSSSDLSDCDEQDSSRLDCLTLNSLNPSTGLSAIGANFSSISETGKSVRAKGTTRRLEIIRELVDTEKTHTEKLKQLNDLLYKPIKAEGLVPPDQLKMVFSCHKTLLKIHRQIYKKLSAAQQNISDHHREPLVGKALIEIFDGELGKRLEKAASTFCACQSTNADLLNRVTRKDTKAGEFLAQVANQQMLGRLGIKDLLASCFQRLTKYPLLLDNLLKATPNIGTQAGAIHSKSLSEGSIAITVINHAPGDEQQQVSNVEQQQQNHRFDPNEIATDNNNETNHKTINTSATSGNYEDYIDDHDPSKTTSSKGANNHAETNSTTSGADSLSDEYAYERLCIDRALQLSRQILIHVNEAVNKAIAQNKLKEIWRKTDKNPQLPVIDIDTQQLLHQGQLTLRLAKRSFEVYVLLLTHYLIILTREGNQEKYKLKYFASDGKSVTQFSPIFNIDEHLVTRDSATDENGFYLLCKRKDDERIYEFASQSPAERSKWKEKIHMAQLYNYPVVPDDDNTLTRYRELISLATSSNTPNNVELSPTNNNNNLTAATTTIVTNSAPASANTSLSNDNVSADGQNQALTATAVTTISSGITTASDATTTAPAQQIVSNNGIGLDLKAQVQDV